jgi:gamma-glutamylcyclotransferase (GGCT)/AIG2-like uncharacterized protein YtfP
MHYLALIMSIWPSEVKFLAVYGTLRRRNLSRLGYSVQSSLKFVCCGLLRGFRLAQRSYPAVLEQPGLVEVEIFQVLRDSIWPTIDRYEGFDHKIGRNSLFIRKTVALVRPRIWAWVYFLGLEIPRGQQTPLPARSWRAPVPWRRHCYPVGLCQTSALSPK